LPPLLATGARRDEVAGLSWTELDRAAREWTLPASRSKNGKAHIIPLNDLAMGALDDLALVSPDQEDPKWPVIGLVFTTTGKAAVSGYSRAKKRLDKAVAEAADSAGSVADFPPWRTHDIRRTVATGLQRLGVRFEVTEAVLNHVSGSRSGVAGVYQRHDWKVEKRAALNAWGTHLSSLSTPADRSNVIEIRRSTVA
jgi:integrase